MNLLEVEAVNAQVVNLVQMRPHPALRPHPAQKHDRCARVF